MTSVHSRTWVKIWQITQGLLNDQFTNAITQKVIKTNLSITIERISGWKIKL